MLTQLTAAVNVERHGLELLLNEQAGCYSTCAFTTSSKSKQFSSQKWSERSFHYMVVSYMGTVCGSPTLFPLAPSRPSILEPCLESVASNS